MRTVQCLLNPGISCLKRLPVSTQKMIDLLKPEHIVLSHGPPDKVKGNKGVALSLGYKEENIHIVRDEEVLEI